MKSLFFTVVLTLFCHLSLAQPVYNTEPVRPYQEKSDLADKTNDETNISSLPSSVAIEKTTVEQTSNKATKTQKNKETQTSTIDNGPQFVGQPTVITADNSPEIETIITGHRIYQCRKGNATVYADEDNKNKFQNCKMIRDQQVAHIIKEPEPTASFLEPCSGMIQFRGNTYIFDGKSPCPIPEDLFQTLTPIEAQPNYYLNSPSESPQS
ncbi:MAG: hypothetical protein CSA10_01350 [Cardiobacteriales bacterium]|nr:MAG: hypothetical protein CSA10_01350 [Cardiobacteriales bacterium]